MTASSKHIDKFKHVQKSLCRFKQVQTSLYKFKQVFASSNQFMQVQTSFCKFKPVKTWIFSTVVVWSLAVKKQFQLIVGFCFNLYHFNHKLQNFEQDGSFKHLYYSTKTFWCELCPWSCYVCLIASFSLFLCMLMSWSIVYTFGQ